MPLSSSFLIFVLPDTYLSHILVERDEVEARSCLTKLKDQAFSGQVDSQFALGKLYFQGAPHVPVNILRLPSFGCKDQSQGGELTQEKLLKRSWVSVFARLSQHSNRFLPA